MRLPSPPGVAPFAGAWIETHENAIITRGIASLPSRERGLKLGIQHTVIRIAESLPSRERGLKHEVPEYVGSQVESRSLRGSVD